MATKITFKKFQAMRVFFPDLSVEVPHDPDLKGKPGYSYDGYWIERFTKANGEVWYQTICSNTNPASPKLEEVERELYEYVKHEIND